MPIGKRIYLKRPMPAPELVKAFSEIPAAIACDAMDRLTAMHPRIRLVSSPICCQTAGVALTVKVRAGDNLALHAAMELAVPGDFIVVSNEGDGIRALMGSNMMTYLSRVRKIAGIVVDGPIRDMAEIRSFELPVYANGSTPGGPYKNGPGEVNVPVACGNICVCPGDIILADTDGVIVIPQADAQSVLLEAQKIKVVDQRKLEETKANVIDRSWVSKLIEKEGFELLDRPYYE